MKFSKFVAFLVGFVAVVSTSCKDDDDEPFYVPTEMDLNVDDFHVRYGFNTFSAYHSDMTDPTYIFEYNKIINVTKFKADTTCFIAYYSSKNEVTEEQLEQQIVEEQMILEADKEFGGQGVTTVLSDTVLGEENIKATSIMFYFDENTKEEYKFIFYYLYNPYNKRAYRIRLSGPTTSTAFWTEADKVLSTFRWQESR